MIRNCVCRRLVPLRTKLWLLPLAVLCAAPAAQAQLRIVSYNTTTAEPDLDTPDPNDGLVTPRAGMDIVLKSIGEELKNGIAKPIDVLLLQEQFTMAVTTQAFVDLLNGIYGAGTYARGSLDGLTSDPFARAGRPGVVYNTQTVQLLEEVRFGAVNGSNQARSTMRYKLQPVGYDASAIFYAYNDHYKAGTAGDDPNNPVRRGLEATNIRTHATYGSNALGEGAHAIYAGDHNTYTSSEAAIVNLTAAGPGQAVDPINTLGAWSNNASFAAVHTQSPCASSCIGATGGMDDRFDFQFVTGEMMDGEGLSVISNSYHPFGNNGTTYNTNINAGSNTYPFPGPPSMTYTKSQILTALRNVSDHVPVVADYQLPAVLQTVAGAVPTALHVGQTFNLGVTVSNAANVAIALGADELDYSASSSGAISGSFLNQIDPATGGGNSHQFALNTSTTGMKTGAITVTSTSQMVQNGTVNIPISYLVVPAGDYDLDGLVDAADYVLWRNTVGQNVANGSGADGSGNGTVDDADYAVWMQNFGQMIAGGAAAGQGFAVANLPGSAIPEPPSILVALVCVCFICIVRTAATR